MNCSRDKTTIQIHVEKRARRIIGRLLHCKHSAYRAKLVLSRSFLSLFFFVCVTFMCIAIDFVFGFNVKRNIYWLSISSSTLQSLFLFSFCWLSLLFFLLVATFLFFIFPLRIKTGLSLCIWKKKTVSSLNFLFPSLFSAFFCSCHFGTSIIFLLILPNIK